MPDVIVVMGVSGSGKTTVGQALAETIQCAFYDGDDFHPPENIVRMSSGIPLTDADRQPWLRRLRDLIKEHTEHDTGIVVACSALKRQYRDILREAEAGLHFVYLYGTFDLIWGRMQARHEHYMQPTMLQSQFDDLEPPTPDEAMHIAIDQPLDAMLREIMRQITAE